jgi:hypothetical protein
VCEEGGLCREGSSRRPGEEGREGERETRGGGPGEEEWGGEEEQQSQKGPGSGVVRKPLIGELVKQGMIGKAGHESEGQDSRQQEPTTRSQTASKIAMVTSWTDCQAAQRQCYNTTVNLELISVNSLIYSLSGCQLSKSLVHNLFFGTIERCLTTTLR